MEFLSAPAGLHAQSPGPSRGWLAVMISCGALIMVAQFGLAVVGATRLVAPEQVTPAPASDTYRLSDKAGRVSVELPKSWWEATAYNAGQVVSDDDGDWVVPDLEASSDSPRWLSVWVDRPWDEDSALARQHETFVAEGCPEESCFADAKTEVTIDGHRGLRQLAHFDDGHLAVMTTLDGGRWMIFVTADGVETTAGATELITISDSIRLVG